MTARLEQLEQCRLVGCSEDSPRFQDALLWLVEIYVKQVVRSESDIARIEEAVTASKVFVEKMAPLSSWKTDNTWTVPDGLDCVQAFTAHSMCYLQNV